MTKKIAILAIVGLIIRLVLIPITMHADFRAYNLAAYLITQKGQLLGFYDYISRLPRTDRILEVFMTDGLFIYPPLAYLTHALFMWLLSPLYPWQTLNTLILYFDHVRPDPHLPWLLYLLKFPYLVADAAGLFIIFKLVDSKRKLLAASLWIFNPVTIYSSYMLAQFDIYIAVFLLLALLLAARGRSLWAAVCIGLAAGFKPFPLLLVPFLGQGLWGKFKHIGLAFLTYLIIIFPYLSSPAFRQYALLADQTEKLWFAKIPVSGGQSISIFLLGLVLLLWWNFYKPKAMSLAGWLTSILLLFFSVVHYHVQWFTWIVSSLILVLTVKKLFLPSLVLLFCYVAIVLLGEQTLFFGLFGSPFNLAAKFTLMPVDQVVSLIRTVFAATSIHLIYTNVLPPHAKKT
ncbi:MAG: hypothetical protein UX80_C0002G0005 [Candidatus Amesbacteria bacterium GW2011_GWA2_47_11b]|uniref:DUF2029 domain-containing protein n=3 Tax=Candidatus Amesiibacteriota TaxID=1752730 RepID=A0A0G1SLI0_9BACT|nr:MAG: hypothetical protein UX42_C0001G0121 [Microgenomates group bacterium GW2011_GWC1_46_20]KKU58470.1 MAG: hypothetical protein UX80_C0002G0005 [Candidatus Amesbacteria bacterium GW2011_GWA2_47_11b]KKU70281.1 MAG: hypothetical protein UX92_C0002G0025 [Candidatus Amesbacteria bacterium GW2011_GWA1_47_20]KKU84898.1 MAG: hypothetical protein UY11_C0001G0004 [Candidatus Amesbacteria bacterium GW2011_GWC2_47_8]